MAKTELVKTGKDNSRKQPYKAEQWAEKKRADRPKQRWVIVENSTDGAAGYWEKI